MVITLEQLAKLVRGRLVGDGELPIRAARPIQEAGPGDITFVEGEKYARMLRSSPATAAIVGPHFLLQNPPEPLDHPLPVIEVVDPMRAFLAVRSHLAQRGRTRWQGIHPSAHVAPSAKIGADVAIHPFACIGEDVEIGPGCTIHVGAVVGAGSRLGAGVTLHPHVVLYEGITLGERAEVHAGTVLGGDGFGYRTHPGGHEKIPQTGTVDVGEDVEIGANCTIDRGTFGATTIGAGTKIDNLVMIGHNNKIGRHNLLCAQVGMAGSCQTGDYVVMAGQVGIKDHTEIGNQVMIGAQAGVHRNIPEGQQVLGSPAVPIKEQRQLFALIARLPSIHREMKAMKAEIARLRAQLGGPATPGVSAEHPEPDGTA